MRRSQRRLALAVPLRGSRLTSAVAQLGFVRPLHHITYETTYSFIAHICTVFCLANSYDDDEAIRRAAQQAVDFDKQQREAARERADGIDTSSQDNSTQNNGGGGVGIYYIIVVLAGVGYYFWDRSKGQKQKPQPVPKPVSRSYFFSLDGKDSGPYSVDEMRLFRRSGTVSDETLVVRLGDSEWQPASVFTEISF